MEAARPEADNLKNQLLTLAGIPFDQVLSSINDGVVVVDRAGTIVFVNPSYSRILKMPPEYALGRNMQEVTPNAHTLRVLRTGKPLLYDSHYSHDLGFDVVMSATPIFQDGVLVGAVTVFRPAEEMIELYSAYRRAHGLVDYYQELLVQEKTLFRFFEKIVGHSGNLVHAVKMAARVAGTDATVLVTGENGVGKDILAEAIHQSSGRRDKAFIVVNCAAIPESLLESELFGFEQGAFTGAARGGRLGRFELADGGTMFLDEIGDMSLPMQAKLLRVLQNKEIQRVGSNRVIHVDARVIAATNRDLDQMVRDGQFREDLLYRLNVFPIAIPPLRERKSDIPRLVKHFLDEYCGKYGKSLITAPETFETLNSCDWPGNVRQLRNAIERAVILCDGSILLPQHFDLSEVHEPPPGEGVLQKTLKGQVREVERKAYEDALSSSEGNKSRAILKLGVSRRTFYKRLREFNMA